MSGTSPMLSPGRPQEVRELLGRQLRLLRVSKRVSPGAAGRHIGASASKISRIELGRVKVKDDDLDRLLTLYEVTDPAGRRAMMDIAWRTNNRQWWHDYSDVLPGWFCSYLMLEPAAQNIRTYEVQFIPGLLQTPAYAEAVIRLRYTDDAEIKRRVDVRMQRQRMLDQQRSPHLWAIVDEAALHRQVGGPQVMREQIEFLIRATRLQNVRIQILPFDAGRAVVGNSFSILRLRIKEFLDVVYLEQIDSALYFSDPNESDPYALAMNHIGVEARRPDETVAILERILRSEFPAE